MVNRVFERMVKNLKVPTGNICVIQGEHGPLEFLSVGDYGKNANIKADFLGITRELHGVQGEVMPLSQKWVITISTQYGCSMNCTFCDVPKVGRGRNATFGDLQTQLLGALSLHQDVQTKRLNIHYARMGEPTFNFAVLEHARSLHETVQPYVTGVVHPVVSTMLPRHTRLEEFLHTWCVIKNEVYNGDAGLQFSINSTEDAQRREMFRGNSLDLSDIARIANDLPWAKGRKYALNFALADNYVVNAKKLATLFDPRQFMVKITPLHATQSCSDNNIVTTNGYEAYTPYQKVENDLKNEGFDVIVFVPSYDEDLGLITCGNAILSGSLPKVPYEVVSDYKS